MKILQIVNPVIPFPAKTVGGTERVVQYLVDELVNYGHDVTLMAHNDSVVHPGVKAIPIGTYLDQKTTVRKIWRHLLFNHYDVIHNHGRLLYFFPEIWSNTRKIHTFHMANLESVQFSRLLNLKPRNFTISPCAKWIQEKYANLPGDWQYVNNGLPLNAYSYNNKEPKADAPLVIICRISQGKGVLDAVDIALKSQRKLIIAGKVGDYPHEREWFDQNLKNLCDGTQIKFIGPIDDQTKNILLNNAAALLIPTTDSEAFNTTMLEANACGCPVISYNRFCFPEFIIDGVNGYLGETIGDLIEAVSNLDKIDRCMCRRLFENKYSSKLMTDNYLKLYNSKV